MQISPVTFELDGWSLFWADLELREPDAEALATMRREVAKGVRQRLTLDTLASHAPIAAMRKLFRAAGCDPTRYRPSSEALLRRLLKGADVPAVMPLVDVNNCLSARLAVPCCVMAEGTFGPPFTVRSGRPGESYESLRGPFNLEGKPLLADAAGPCDAPITGSQRVKVTPATRHATLVAYLPVAVDPTTAQRALSEILEATGIARNVASGVARP